MVTLRQRQCGWRVAALLAVVVLWGVAECLASTLEIAVVSSRDIAPYRAAHDGFFEVLDQAGIRYRTVEYHTEGDAKKIRDVVQKIRSRRSHLILTIGSAATETIATQIRDIPIVFSLVLDGASEIDLETLGDNITGASMRIPVRVQFEKLREALPEAVRFGVLYNPDKTGKIIAEAHAIAEELGLKLVPVPVRDESEVADKLAELDGKIDVLWSVADPTVFTPQSMRYILLNTLRSRIPLVGLSPSYVRAGALLSLSCDYRDVGRQAGEQALQLLGGSKPDQVPMTHPRTISTHLNMNTARMLHVEIAEPVRVGAEVISDS